MGGDSSQIDTCGRQAVSCLPFGSCGRKYDLDVFCGRKLAHDVDIAPLHGFELSRPIRGVVRPPDPGSPMLRPFGRHDVLVFVGETGV